MDARGDATAIASFEKSWSDKNQAGLRCRVASDPPRLGFTLRQWAGYSAILPVEQFQPGARVAVLTRVTAEGAKPVYFFQGLGLRRIPRRDAQAYVSGGVMVGPGKYRVAFLAVDQQGRSCRKEWTWNVPRGKTDGLAPGTIEDLGLDQWKGFTANSATGIRRVSVVLHAAPIYRRRYAVKLSGWDRYVLVSVLRSVLEQSGASSARVIVHDWFGRKVLFEDGDFTPASYEKLVAALEDASYGTVDYKVLRDGPGPAAFLNQLLDRARVSPEPQALVFAGPEAGIADKRTADSETWKADPTPAFYVVFPRFVTGPEDIVARFVKTVKGRVYSIFAPTDLARALRGINENWPAK
jgi:hypothetical protein